jgi:5-oxoprolinase (ATP-hydrolysing)
VRGELQRLKVEGGFDSVAVVLMHSYACPESELQIGDIARELGYSQVSLSHQIMRRVKLVKRGQTCCVDAYLNPHIYRYITGFKEGFDSQLLQRVQVFFM